MFSFPLLVSGYIRQTISLPMELAHIILAYHPKLMKFDLFDEENFICSNDGKFIQGQGKTCGARFVYIGYSTFMRDGFDEGDEK